MRYKNYPLSTLSYRVSPAESSDFCILTSHIRTTIDYFLCLLYHVDRSDAEKTRNQLEKTAVACKNFQDALGTFKDVALKEPTFWTNAKDVENIEKAKYKQGGPILDAADVYVLELKEEDIEEIKENLGEDQKEELFPRQINEEKEDANSLYYKHSQKLEKEKLQREAEENARIREEQETAQNYVDNYVKPIPAVTWSVSETNSSKRKYEPSLFDRPTAEKSWKNYFLLLVPCPDCSSDCNFIFCCKVAVKGCNSDFGS